MSAFKSTLHDAIVVLTGHENAKTRLTNAWVNLLETVAADELPDGIRQTFLAMRDKLTAHQPVNKEHPIVATIRKMSPMEAATCAQDVVHIYLQVVSAESPVQLRLVETADHEDDSATAESVPDFLTQH
ncbi:MAG: hypothetical protein AAF004_02005 [Pseudomonadota bacterium]